MKFFKNLKAVREANSEAMQNSQALLDELDRTESYVDAKHEEALDRLIKSKEQAVRLRAANQRNHFSEGLTKSFKGRPA